MSRLWQFLLLCVALAAAPACAQTFPQFTGLVTDAAGVLPADRKAALEARLEALQQQTNRQLVVATIPDLQGYDIADYGYRLGRAWAVGLKGADNGAILIVAPKERKVRVEVGYGLEPVLTDAFSSVIIQTRIIPAFKAGDMAGGIEAGADALIQQLSLPDDQAKAKVAEAVQAYDKSHARTRQGGGIPFGVIFWLVIVGVIFVSSIARRAGGTGRAYGGGGGSNWPIWLWAASEVAEAKTDGEISAIVAASSDAYHDVALHYALLLALLPLAVSAAWPGLLEWGASLFTGWDAPSLRFMLTLLLLKTAFVFLVARLLLGLPALRMALTPGATKTRRVRRRALMLFRTGTEQRTLSKTGVLLYLSLAEHRAEIVADAAIHALVPQEEWGEAMAALIAAIRDDRPGDGIVAAIERIGTVLSRHFPYTGNDPNELPDRLIQL